MPRSTKINSKSSISKQNVPPPAPAPTYTPLQAPSMFDTIKQGFSFGVGSSIAHNIFDSKSKDTYTNTNANANANTNANTNTNESKLTADKLYELYNKCLDNNINNNNNIDCNIIFQNMNNK
jgi:hypothetical protein